MRDAEEKMKGPKVLESSLRQLTIINGSINMICARDGSKSRSSATIVVLPSLAHYPGFHLSNLGFYQSHVINCGQFIINQLLTVSRKAQGFIVHTYIFVKDFNLHTSTCLGFKHLQQVLHTLLLLEFIVHKIYCTH